MVDDTTTLRGCRFCGAAIPRRSGPGRPSVRCAQCRDKRTKPQRVCPLIPDKRLKAFTNPPEWLRVTWPRPARIPYGRKVIRRTCVECASVFRGMPHETRCPACPPPVKLGKPHGPFIKDIGPLHDVAAPERLICEFCNLGFWYGHGRGRKYCSNSCEKYGNGRASLSIDVAFDQCIECGRGFCYPTFRKNVGFCSLGCNQRARKRSNRHRRRAHNRAGENFTLREIAERDNWRCHICGGKVPDRKYAARDKDPTIDHLIPVADGGEHTRQNVALAHNRCNWERSNEGAAQLRLVG